MIPANSHNVSRGMIVLTILAGLSVLSTYSYLLFHSLAEIFSVVVATGVFIIAWNARTFMNNNYFMVIGISCLFVGSLDLLHALAYKNMGVFPGYDTDVPTQLWIAARLVQSVSFIAAPAFLRRRVDPGIAFAACCVVTGALIAAIFSGVFPRCFVEGEGLTLFKKTAEYVVVFLLLGSLLLVRRHRSSFDPEVARLLTSAFIALILSELAFTLYTDVFGITNMMGHLFKIVGFYFIYTALIEIGLAKPYNLLFLELKKSEEALVLERNQLRESEERYRHLYQDTPVMLHSLDRQGRLVNVSNYWLEHLGYERHEVLSRKSTEFLTEASRRFAEQEVIPQFFKTGSCNEVPYQVVKKNGEEIDVLLTARAERDEQGEVLYSLAVMVDVTERKRAEEKVEMLNTDLMAQAAELRATNAELEAFSYTVSHDLRTPLANISVSSTVLTELVGDTLPEQAREFLGYIDSETKRMSRMIDTMLKFSQLGRKELCIHEVDLSQIATNVALNLKVMNSDREVEFVIAEGARCRGDRDLLHAAMENLLGNAWKYSRDRESARIEFGVTDEKGERTFFVRDNGVGFPPEKAKEIFLPFHRLHSQEFEGTGIGLATVARIIERHHGSILAEGDIGKGATIYFTVGT